MNLFNLFRFLRLDVAISGHCLVHSNAVLIVIGLSNRVIRLVRLD